MEDLEKTKKGLEHLDVGLKKAKSFKILPIGLFLLIGTICGIRMFNNTITLTEVTLFIGASVFMFGWFLSVLVITILMQIVDVKISTLKILERLKE